MPFRLGSAELTIILLIVVVLFGVGRLGKIGSELGRAMRGFRAGINGAPDADSKSNH